MPKNAVQSVAILYPASLPWMAQCLDGIRAYAKAHGNWQLITSPPPRKAREKRRSMRVACGDGRGV